jgi:hypothetical protein
MSRFVPHDLETLLLSATFDFEHLLALQFGKARVSEIEGDGEAGNVVRREPFFGQPDMRLETQTASLPALCGAAPAAFSAAMP